MVSGLVAMVVAPADSKVVGLLGFGLTSLVAMMLAALVGEHLFLLDPHRYLAWLRVLGPYEPETFWGQAGHQLASWVGGTGLLVLGAVVGALFGSQADTSHLAPNVAMAWIGHMLVVGVPFLWWSAFLVKLASLHRRAIRRGVLPVRPTGGPFGLFLLFSALWAAGVAVVLAVVVGGPEALRALDGATSK